MAASSIRTWLGRRGDTSILHVWGYHGMHEAGDGEGLEPIISPVRGLPRLTSCTPAPLLSLAQLVLLSSEALGLLPGVLHIPRPRLVGFG